MPHIFKTRQGRKARRMILDRDGWQCQMCGVLLTGQMADPHGAVVDHIEPVALSPHRERDAANMRAVCRSCHALCDSIEKRYAGDLAAIVAVKRANGRGSLNVYDDWPNR